MKKTITILIISLFFSLTLLLFKAVPANAQEAHQINISAQVAANLTVNLDYPKDGSFYLLGSDQYLTLSGFSNIRGVNFDFTIEEMEIEPVKYHNYFQPDEYGNWQWTIPENLGPGDYRVVIEAHNQNNSLYNYRSFYFTVFDMTQAEFEELLSQRIILDKSLIKNDQKIFIDNIIQEKTNYQNVNQTITSQINRLMTRVVVDT